MIHPSSTAASKGWQKTKDRSMPLDKLPKKGLQKTSSQWIICSLFAILLPTLGFAVEVCEFSYWTKASATSDEPLNPKDNPVRTDCLIPDGRKLVGASPNKIIAAMYANGFKLVGTEFRKISEKEGRRFLTFVREDQPLGATQSNPPQTQGSVQRYALE